MSGVSAVGSASDITAEQQLEIQQEMEKGIGSLMAVYFEGQINDITQAFNDDTSTPDS